MGLVKFIVNRFLGDDNDLDDNDLDDDDLDDDDLDDDNDLDDDDLDTDLVALSNRVKNEGVLPRQNNSSRNISFGRKWCPTRHGCTGATNCDHAYGAPD